MNRPAPITALVYSDSDLADRTLRAVAGLLMEDGLRLGGLVQHNNPRPGRSRCDMMLEDLTTGACVPISQDRGPHARGCALEVGQLLAAMEMVRQSLAESPNLVILNKFGKSESEGRGFRPLLAELLELQIPVLIAVPWRNIENWRQFAGEYAVEVPVETDDAAALIAHCGLGALARDQDAAVSTVTSPGTSRPASRRVEVSSISATDSPASRAASRR